MKNRFLNIAIAASLLFACGEGANDKNELVGFNLDVKDPVQTLSGAKSVTLKLFKTVSAKEQHYASSCVKIADEKASFNGIEQGFGLFGQVKAFASEDCSGDVASQGEFVDFDLVPGESNELSVTMLPLTSVAAGGFELAKGMSHSSAVMVTDKLLFLAGGFSPAGESCEKDTNSDYACSKLTATKKYMFIDLSTNKIVSEGNLKSARAGASLVFLGDRIILVGGAASATIASKDYKISFTESDSLRNIEVVILNNNLNDIKTSSLSSEDYLSSRHFGGFELDTLSSNTFLAPQDEKFLKCAAGASKVSCLTDTDFTSSAFVFSGGLISKTASNIAGESFYYSTTGETLLSRPANSEKLVKVSIEGSKDGLSILSDGNNGFVTAGGGTKSHSYDASTQKWVAATTDNTAIDSRKGMASVSGILAGGSDNNGEFKAFFAEYSDGKFEVKSGDGPAGIGVTSIYNSFGNYYVFIGGLDPATGFSKKLYYYK